MKSKIVKLARISLTGLIILIALMLGTSLGLFLGRLPAFAATESIATFTGYDGSSYYWKGKIVLEAGNSSSFSKDNDIIYVSALAPKLELRLETASHNVGALSNPITGQITITVKRDSTEISSHLFDLNVQKDSVRFWRMQENGYFQTSNIIYSTSSQIADGNYTVSWSSDGFYRGFYSNDAFSGSCSFVIDNTNPTLSLSSTKTGTDGKTYANSAFSVTASDTNFKSLYTKTPSSAVYSPQSTTSKTISSGSANGAYSFYALDKASNSSSYSTVYYDTNAPIISSSVAHGGYTKSGFTVSVSDNIALENFYIQRPGQAYTTVSGNSVAISAGSTTGTYSFYATDMAGNQSSTYNIFYDNLLPSITCTNLSGATISTNSYISSDFKIVASDSESGIASIHYKHSSAGSFTSVSASIHTIPSTATNGWYTFYCKDKAGNESAQHTVYLDTVKPIISGTVGSGSYTKTGFTISGSDSTFHRIYVKDPLSSTYSFVSTESYYVSTGATNGLWEFYVEDKAGNRSDPYSVHYDNVLPSITCSGGLQNNGFTNQAFTISAQDLNSSGIARLYYSNTGDVSQSSEYTTNSTFTVNVTSGNSVWSFMAVDRAGNSSPVFKITLDITKPNGTITNASGNELLSAYTNVSFKYIATDTGGSGISRLEFLPPSATEWQVYDGSLFSSTASDDGLYSFRTLDRAGTYSDTSTITFDKTKPVLSCNDCAHGGYSNNASIRIVASDNIAFDKIYYKAPESSAYQSVSLSYFSAINTPGQWVFYAEDQAGNKSEEYRIYFDNVPPIGEILNNSNGVITNITRSTFKFSAQDSHSGIATLMCLTPDAEDTWIEYNSGTLFQSSSSTNGIYMFYAEDRAGNRSPTYSIVLDTQPPTGEIIANDAAVASGGLTRYSILFTWSEPNCSATRNGVSYTNGTLIAAEGTHTFVLADQAGNTSTYNITIDKTPPVGTLSANGTQLSSGAITRYNVMFSWTENGAFATRNLEAYTSNTAVSAEGEHVFELTDRAGNSSYYTITIKKTPATGVVKTITDMIVPNNGYTNQAFHFAWLEPNCSATVNGSPYAAETILSKDGTYLFVLTDIAGNTSSYTVVLDTVAPSGVLSAGYTPSASTDLFTNKAFSFAATDDVSINSLYIKIPGNAGWEIYNGLSLPNSSASGLYQFYADDKAGNRSPVYTVTLDMDAPIVTITKNGELAFTGAGGTINASLQTELYFKLNDRLVISVDDVNFSICYLDNNIKNINTNISINSAVEVGKHLVKVADKAGNETYLDFYVDNTAPSITIGGIRYSGGTQDEPYILFFREAKSLEWITRGNANDYAPVTMTLSSTGATIVNDTYVSGGNLMLTTPVSSETKYLISLIDKAGNQAFYTIYIDRLAPVGTLISQGREILTGAIISADFFALFTESGVTASYVCDDKSGEYLSRHTFVDEGTYTITLKDQAGNTTAYIVTIDKTPPVGTLLANNVSIETGSTTRFDVSFTWTESGAVATHSENVYTKGASVSAEGEHLFMLTDLAGNSSAYTVTIDKTAPSFAVVDVSNQELAKKAAFNINVKIVWTEADCTATLNGSPYSSSALVSDERQYTFIITDKYGNSTQPYIFTLDFTPFTDNYDYFINTYKTSTINHWWETFTLIFDSASNNYRNGTYYAFNNYRDAYNYAYQRENSIIETGVWQSGETIYSEKYQRYIDRFDPEFASSGSMYYIYKNPATGAAVAYFSTVNLNIALDHYATIGISEKYIPSIPAIAYPGSEEWNIPVQEMLRQKVFVKYSSPISFYYKPANGTLVVNGMTQSYNTTLTIGEYYIVEIDLAGNSFEYTLVVDGEAPSIKVTDERGNILSTEEYYFATRSEIRITSPIKISAVDTFDIDCLMLVSYPGHSLSFISGASFTVLETGTYTIEARDRAGNVSRLWTLIVSLESPEIIYTEEYDNEDLLTGFSIEIKKNNTINAFSSIKIYYYSEDTGVYTLLTRDDYNTLISASTLGYRFYTSGRYKTEITDNFGRDKEELFEIWRDRPYGKLFVNGLQIRNGSVIYEDDGVTIKEIYPAVTNSGVSLWWKYDASNLMSAVVNGDTDYTMNTVISAEGVYIIRLTNRDMQFTDFVFEIDKTAPKGNFVVDGTAVASNTTTNGEVLFTWTEADCTATIDGFVYQKNSPITEEGAYLIRLRDKAGNTASYSIAIDRTPPKVKIMANSLEYASGSIVNKNVYFMWGESNCTALVNGQPYSEYTPISTEGTFILVVSDRVGNTASYSITIDKTPPKFSLFDINNNTISTGAIINKDFYITWEEDFIVARVNGISYIKESVLTLTDTYSIVLTDRAGNSTAATVYIDKALPFGTLKANNVEVSSETITRFNIMFTWEKTGCTVLRNGTVYTKGTMIISEGKHTFVISDKAGNSLSYEITIDKTAPSGTLFADGIEISSGTITKENVHFSWIEENCNALLNGEAYSKETLIVAPGDHTFVLTDLAGNSLTYKVTIKKNQPQGSILANGEIISSGSVTRQNISFSWTETGCTATRNGAAYTKDTYVTAEGVHTFVLTDRAGNSSTYFVAVDKTLPVGKILSNLGELSTGSVVKEDIYFVWDEFDCTATVNGVLYESGTLISEQGLFTFILTDRAGNNSTYNAVIDKSPKEGTLLANNKVIEDGSITKYDVQFTWSATGATATLNDGSAYYKSYYVRTEGTHTFTLTDVAGNISTYTVTIDKSAPEGFLFADNVKLPAGGLTSCGVTFVWQEEDCSATLNGQPYENNNLIEEEGLHTFILTDRAGNSSAYTVTIDKTPPVGVLKANSVTIQSDDLTRYNVSFSWTETGCTATRNGITYTKDTYVTAEGVHTFVLTDRAGNSSTYSVTIDKTAPTGILAAENNVIIDPGSVINYNFKFVWDAPDVSVLLNGAPYIQDQVVSAEGRHSILITDRAGNSSTYTITIDKTPPLGVITSNGSVLESGATTRYNIDFTWAESNITVTRNGTAFTRGSMVSTEGEHVFVLIDQAGNTSVYVVVIDKTAPVGELIYFDEDFFIVTGSTVNRGLKFVWNEDGCTSLLNENPYESGAIVDTEGSHIFVLVDKAGNTSTYTVTIDKTPPEGSFMSVSHDKISNAIVFYNFYFTWTEQGCVTTVNGVTYIKGSFISTVGEYTFIITDIAGNSSTYAITLDKDRPTVLGYFVYENDTQEIFSTTTSGLSTKNNITFLFGPDCYAYLNGVDYNSGTIIYSEGLHSFVLYNAAGNSTEFSFTIDKTPPTGSLYVANGSTIISGDLTNQNVKLEWDDSDCLATIDGRPYTRGNFITDEGLFTFVLTDAAGNSSTYSVTIDKTAPTGMLISNEENIASGSTTRFDLFFAWLEPNCLAFCNGEPYSNEVILTAEGLYSFELYDAAGNISIYTITLDKTPPNGSLYTIIGTLLASGESTKENVVFSWTESSATATLNGKVYNNGAVISTEGEHVIALMDRVGNINYYYFAIFKQPPLIQCYSDSYEELLNGSITKKNILFDWTLERFTALLNGEHYEKGAILVTEGEYLLVLTDDIGNQSSFSIIIDKTPPVGSLIVNLNEVNSGSITNQSVKFTWNESGCVATVNDAAYVQGTEIRADGSYTFILTDRAGNSSAYNITIKKSKPALIVYTGFTVDTFEEIALTGFSSVNTAFTFVFSESDSGELNGEFYENGTTITEEGYYTLVIIDTAGNTTIYNCSIDKTPPTGILFANGEILDNEGLTMFNSYLTWSEDNCIATLNGATYRKETIVNKEGAHTFILTDRVGNSSTYTIIIDKTAPIGVLLANEAVLSSGSATNHAVTFSWAEEGCVAIIDGEPVSNGDIFTQEGDYFISLRDRAGNVSNYSFTIDITAPMGTIMSNNDLLLESGDITRYNVFFTWVENNCTATLDGSNYNKNGFVSTEGLHTFVLTDRVGNSATYTITIDKTPPIGTLFANNAQLDSGTITNHDVSFSWAEEGCSATLNGEDYTKGFDISAEGLLTFVLTDLAGNSGSFFVTIDKTPPTGVLSVNNEVIYSGAIVNSGVSFVWTENGCTATLNDEPYYSGRIINGNADYSIKLTDRAGNYSVYFFTIKKNLPVGILSSNDIEISSGSSINSEFIFEWEEANCTATINGETYYSGTLITEENIYILILTDIAGNNSTYTVTIDKTAPTGTLLANGEVLNTGSTTRFNISFSWSEAGATATLNDNAYQKGVIISVAGDYTFILTDRVGNSSTYDVSIKKEKPTMNAYTVKEDENKELIENEVVLSNSKIDTLSSDVKFEWENELYSALLNGEVYENGSLISEEGSYTIILMDELGNSTEYSFKISKTIEETVSEKVNSAFQTTVTILLCVVGGLLVIITLIVLFKKRKNPLMMK